MGNYYWMPSVCRSKVRLTINWKSSVWACHYLMVTLFGQVFTRSLSVWTWFYLMGTIVRQVVIGNPLCGLVRWRVVRVGLCLPLSLPLALACQGCNVISLTIFPLLCSLGITIQS